MRKTKKGHRSRLAGHWNRRSPQPDELERHIWNFQSINSNEESPLMITWSHKANQKGFLRSKDETQLALSFYTRRIVLYQIFVLAVHRSLGPGTDRDGKGKAIIKKHRSSPSSFAHHAQRTLEKCVNVLFEHLIVTGDAEQRLTQSTVNSERWDSSYSLSELTNKKWKAASLALGLSSSPSSAWQKSCLCFLPYLFPREKGFYGVEYLRVVGELPCRFKASFKRSLQAGLIEPGSSC